MRERIVDQTLGYSADAIGVLKEEQPSDRLIDQRIRNRIMEALETLADGDEGVRREWGVSQILLVN